MYFPPLARPVVAIVRSLYRSLRHWPLLRTSCNSCEALGTLLCIQRSGGLGFVLYKLLMKMYHDDEDGCGTSNYDAVNTGNDNVIYIERDRTYWGR